MRTAFVPDFAPVPGGPCIGLPRLPSRADPHIVPNSWRQIFLFAFRPNPEVLASPRRARFAEPRVRQAQEREARALEAALERTARRDGSEWVCLIGGQSWQLSENSARSGW